MKKLLLILLCLPLLFGCGDSLDKEITDEMIEDGYTGKGTYTIGKESGYVGEWKYGKRNGQGTYTMVDGKVYKGLWANDGFLGEENKIFFFINDSTFTVDYFEFSLFDYELIDDSIRYTDISCGYDLLCGDIKDGVGISLYNTGEKEVEVTCGEVEDEDGNYWELKKVIFYYKNGNKKSERVFPSGCDGCGVPPTTWWKNGNLQWEENKYWYENGQIKHEVGIVMNDGRCKATSYYENGQIKKLVICDDIYDDGSCFETPWGNMDYCNGTEECFNKKGKKIECK
jgi:hypothetical protein